MGRILAPKKRPVQMRSVLVELPEDKILDLLARAKSSDETVHVLVGRVLSDWLAK